MSKIIGITQNTGNYQGHDFNNYYLHCTYPISSNKGIGTAVKAPVKIRSKVFEKILGHPATSDDLNDLIGKEISEFYYDEYDNVVDFVID